MKKKILIYLTIIFSCFFVFKSEVRADDSYAKCYYSITGDKDLTAKNPIYLYVHAKNGSVTHEFKNYSTNTGRVDYASWSASLVRAIPFDAMKNSNDSSKLRCPVIYYKVKTTGSYNSNFVYSMSIYKEDLPGDKDRKEMKLFKQDVKVGTNSNVVSNSFSCPYYSEAEKDPILIVNVKDNGEVQVPSGFTKGNDFKDSLFKTKCPKNIWLRAGVNNIIYTKDVGAAGNPNAYFKLSHKQSNLAADGQYDENGNKINPNITIVDPLTGDPMTCESLKDTATYKIVKQVFKWIQIIAPIMLVVFGVIDFATPVISGDNDAIKKAQSKFIKRVIVVAAIVLLPFIMDLLISLLDGAMGNNIGTCNINN